MLKYLPDTYVIDLSHVARNHRAAAINFIFKSVYGFDGYYPVETTIDDWTYIIIKPKFTPGNGHCRDYEHLNPAWKNIILYEKWV